MHPLRPHGRQCTWLITISLLPPRPLAGHLLTSSNYNDDQKKVTGGRNGYGAKLANIFSREFIVETSDSAEGKKFKQTFRNNMTEVGKPVIAPSKQDWTRITWEPDLAKFGMSSMDDDIVALMERRAYDMAGCTHASVKVYLNGTRLPVNDFKSYIDLFLGPKQAPDAVPRVFEKVGDRWEVAVAASDDGFNQVRTSLRRAEMGRTSNKCAHCDPRV